jgi:peptide/nickel transport system ATP-binding protein
MPATSSRPARPRRCSPTPNTPYTQLLLGAVPAPRAPLVVDAETDRGEPPKVIDPPEGCRFRARCPLAIDECARVTPLPRELGPAHTAACHVATADLAGRPTGR